MLDGAQQRHRPQPDLRRRPGLLPGLVPHRRRRPATGTPSTTRSRYAAASTSGSTTTPSPTATTRTARQPVLLRPAVPGARRVAGHHPHRQPGHRLVQPVHRPRQGDADRLVQHRRPGRRPAEGHPAPQPLRRRAPAAAPGPLRPGRRLQQPLPAGRRRLRVRDRRRRAVRRRTPRTTSSASAPASPPATCSTTGAAPRSPSGATGSGPPAAVPARSTWWPRTTRPTTRTWPRTPAGRRPCARGPVLPAPLVPLVVGPSPAPTGCPSDPPGRAPRCGVRRPVYPQPAPRAAAPPVPTLHHHQEVHHEPRPGPRDGRRGCSPRRSPPAPSPSARCSSPPRPRFADTAVHRHLRRRQRRRLVDSPAAAGRWSPTAPPSTASPAPAATPGPWPARRSWTDYAVQARVKPTGFNGAEPARRRGRPRPEQQQLLHLVADQQRRGRSWSSGSGGGAGGARLSRSAAVTVGTWAHAAAGGLRQLAARATSTARLVGPGHRRHLQHRPGRPGHLLRQRLLRRRRRWTTGAPADRRRPGPTDRPDPAADRAAARPGAPRRSASPRSTRSARTAPPAAPAARPSRSTPPPNSSTAIARPGRSPSGSTACITLPGPMHDVTSDKTIVGVGANSGITGGGLTSACRSTTRHHPAGRRRAQRHRPEPELPQRRRRRDQRADVLAPRLDRPQRPLQRLRRR